MPAFDGNARRPRRFGLWVVVAFFGACAHVPTGPPPPAWVQGHVAQKDGRQFVVARGGPTGMPSHARGIALQRAAEDLARRLGEVTVVARSYEHQRDGGGDSSQQQSAMGEESESLIKAVLKGLRVDAEWVDVHGRYTGVGGRVYYLLVSIPNGGPS